MLAKVLGPVQKKAGVGVLVAGEAHSIMAEAGAILLLEVVAAGVLQGATGEGVPA